MMLGKIKSTLIRKAGPMGGYRIAKALTKNKPKILMYHRFAADSSAHAVGIDAFEQQARILAQNFNVIDLNDLSDHLRAHSALPQNAIVLTIDDGYADFYHFAFPILKRYKLTATLYVTTGFIDREIWLWPDVVDFVFNRTELNSVTIAGHSFEWSQQDIRHVNRIKQEVVAYCKTLQDDAKWQFLDDLASELGVVVPEEPDSDYEPLTWDQLNEMAQYGINIGGHTCTHPILSNLNTEHLVQEINGCKERLESQLHTPIRSFCFPNGQPGDYNETIKQVIVSSGYENCTAAHFREPALSDLFELKRNAVSSDMFQFLKVIHGFEHLSDMGKSIIS